MQWRGGRLASVPNLLAVFVFHAAKRPFHFMQSALGTRPTLRPAGHSRRQAMMPNQRVPACPARPTPPARRSVAPAAVSTSSAAAKKTQPMPFVKLADQEEMKLALLLNVVDPAVGGVLIMGDRGTGKSVAVSA